MVICCVPNCDSQKYYSEKAKKNGGTYISFHEFPSDLPLRYKWLRAIARKDFQVNDYSSIFHVCSKHFKDDDFIPFSKKRILKKNSVPSVFSNYPEYILSSASPENDISLSETCDEKEKVEPCSDNEDTSMSDSKKERKPSVFLNYVKYMMSSSISKQDISLFESCNEKKRLDTYSDSKETMIETSHTDYYPSVLPDNPNYIMPSSSPKQNFLLSESCNEKVIIDHFADVEDTDMTDIGLKDLKTETFPSETKKIALEVKRLRKQLWNKDKRIQKLSNTDVNMKKELESFTKDVHHQNLRKMLALNRKNLSTPKVKLILTQLKYMFGETFRWPENVLHECVLLNSVSPQGYKMIVERDFITLPSKTTLRRYSGPVIYGTGISSPTNSRSEEEEEMPNLKRHSKPVNNGTGVLSPTNSRSEEKMSILKPDEIL